MHESTTAPVKAVQPSEGAPIVSAPAVTVRRATPDDASALAAISSHPETFALLGSMPFQVAGQWRDLLASAGDFPLVLVAESRHRPIGYCKLASDGGGRRRVHAATVSIAVDPNRRREGIASLLLVQAIEAAEFWYGIQRLEVQVLANNANAIALYERHGFEREGILRNWVLYEGQLCNVYAMSRLGNGTGAIPA